MHALRTMYFSADAPRLYQAPRQSCRPRNERSIFISVPKRVVSATAVRKPIAASRPFSSKERARPYPSDTDDEAPGGRHASIPIPSTPAGGWFGLFKAFAPRDSCSPPKTFQGLDFEMGLTLAFEVALPNAVVATGPRMMGCPVRFGATILPRASSQTAHPSLETVLPCRPNARPWLESPPTWRFANAAR